jgi:hypothetical protein
MSQGMETGHNSKALAPLVKLYSRAQKGHRVITERRTEETFCYMEQALHNNI